MGTFTTDVASVVNATAEKVVYWRRYKKAQHALEAVPPHLLGDLGICRMQIPVIAAYAAVAQVDIATAIDHITRFPPASLSTSHVR